MRGDWLEKLLVAVLFLAVGGVAVWFIAAVVVFILAILATWPVIGS